MSVSPNKNKRRMLLYSNTWQEVVNTGPGFESGTEAKLDSTEAGMRAEACLWRKEHRKWEEVDSRLL